VEGKDAVNKLTIILLHAYGIVTQANEILHLGITQLHADDARYAREKGFNIKLVANARRIGNEQIAAYVLPTFVGRKSQLHYVRNEFNGVLIGSKLADEQFIYGKGAGRFPTSSAVLSDISALRYDYRYEYKKARKNLLYSLTGNHVIRLFVSYSHEGDVDPRSFIDIEETYHSHQRKYMVGTISLEGLREALWLKGHGVSVIEVGDQS
jgi:homoserine dehydrogenase